MRLTQKAAASEDQKNEGGRSRKLFSSAVRWPPFVAVDPPVTRDHIIVIKRIRIEKGMDGDRSSFLPLVFRRSSGSLSFIVAAMIAFVPRAWGLRMRHGTLAWLVADDFFVTRGGRRAGLAHNTR